MNKPFSLMRVHCDWSKFYVAVKVRPRSHNNKYAAYVSQFIQVSLNSSLLKSHRIQDVYTVDMAKIIKLQLRFLLLEIYLDSFVYTSANMEHIKFVQLCCEFTWVNAFTL